MNLAKGRICIKWGIAQEVFYKMHPDFKKKKYCTVFIWTKRMVQALIEMSLNMWKNRCKCLHGHTKAEQTNIKRQQLLKKVKWCYRNR